MDSDGSDDDYDDDQNVDTNVFNVFDIGDESNTIMSLQYELKNWAIEDRIGHSCVTKLLKILRRHNHSELPMDGRTLLGTPKMTSKLIKEVDPGKYFNFMSASTFYE